VVLVSPRSYFVFTPLLASTSVGTLEFRTALEPIRNRRNKAAFIQGWAENVDLFNKTITIEEAVVDPNQGLALTGSRNEGKDASQIQTEHASKSRSGQLFDLRYDKLIIGVGSYNQTFDVPGVKQYANFLKDVGDARKIRKRLLECFETAALPTTPDNIRRQILHFAVVGGGPTGIEFSAELHDLIHEDMARIYPGLTKFTRITVYDVSPKVLSQFDSKLANFAADHFERSGIAIRTSRRIQDLSPGLPDVDPHIQSGRLGFTLRVKDDPDEGIGMCIWSTG
jgi:NADH dehydrogenase FAD-containing subunit